ncbi:MAG: phosphoglucosamine mutase [Clostridiales bacterium]|nr:phosphoglucosamine mutase [Clostridiales bacterium]
MAIQFGTDGVRGVAGAGLTCDTALKLGQAAARCLAKSEGTGHKMLVGKDTRHSCDMLEAALVAGICSMGADVVRLGVIATPGVAVLTERYGACAGFVISASHNPYEHNGIKLFGESGRKLSDEQQQDIEALLSEQALVPHYRTGTEIGRVEEMDRQADEDYVAFLEKAADVDLSHLSVIIDAANGAAYQTARLLAERLGLSATFLGVEPNGANINLDCGSTAPKRLVEAVRAQRADIGIALDGDADRIIAVDERGNLVDGDQLLAIFAEDYRKRGLLRGNTIVGTKISNLGLHKYCSERGIRLICTDVGDRYVLARMLEDSLLLGGEQAGHIILRDYIETGDGQLVGVRLLSLLARSKKPLSQLASVMERYPQITINTKVSDETKKRYAKHPRYLEEREAVEEALKQNGRLLVRPSGTEPVLRVMVEAKTLEQAEAMAKRVAAVLQAIDESAR